MRWRGVLSALAILSTLAVPAAAQPPAPTRTAFDGKYVGTATVGAGEDPVDCRTTTSMDMTIAGGQVLINADYARAPFIYGHALAPKLTFQGSVNAAGEASASGLGFVLMLTGTIRDKVFRGQHRSGRQCNYTIEMVKQ